MSSNSISFPPWSELPPELLTTIATFLKLSDPIDVLSFRCVCKSWFSSSKFTLSSLFPPFPLKIPSPPDTLTNPLMHDHPVLSCTVVYALSPPDNHDHASSSKCRAYWVLFLDQITPGKVSIRQPFSRYSYSLPMNFPQCINLLKFHAYEMHRFYNISCLDCSKRKPFSWFGALLKVVFVRNVGVVVLSDDGKLGLLRLDLGLAKPECNYSEGRMRIDLPLNLENVGGNLEWEIVHSGNGYRFDDIVEFKGALLGIDRRGKVYEIDIGLVSLSPVSMKEIVPPIARGGGRRKRLVESLGKLYLVVRNKVRKETDVVFKVYELNEDTKKWVEVNSLGDRVFFVGLEFSFSVPVEEFYGSCVKNCILFKEQSFLKYNGSDDDTELFRDLNYGDLNVAVWHMDDSAHLDLLRAQPGYLNALWPPPVLIWSIDMIDRIESFLMLHHHMRTSVEKTQAKIKELSGTHQEHAAELMKQVINIEKILDKIKLLEDKWKQGKTVLSRKQHSQSVDQDNQAGISILGAEERQMSAERGKDIIERNLDFDWYSFESNVNTCVIQIEEYFSTLEDDVNHMLLDMDEYLSEMIGH